MHTGDTVAGSVPARFRCSSFHCYENRLGHTSSSRSMTFLRAKKRSRIRETLAFANNTFTVFHVVMPSGVTRVQFSGGHHFF